MSPRCYGLLAEFESAEALLDAVRRARADGFDVEAYAPFAIEGMSEAIGLPRNGIPPVTLFGGILGGALGYFMQWYSAVVAYPLNVGGRPLNSWPAFVPSALELAILGAALGAVLGMLWMNGLPRLRHPLFAVPGFELATRDRFFLCLRADGARFDRARAQSVLDALQPLRVCEVPA